MNRFKRENHLTNTLRGYIMLMTKIYPVGVYERRQI